jgi:hypothetical protein
MGNRTNGGHRPYHHHHHSLEGAPPLQRTFYRWMVVTNGAAAAEVVARLTDAERAMVRAYLGTVRRRPESVAELAAGLRAAVLRYTRPLDAAGDLEDTLAAPLAHALMAATYGGGEYGDPPPSLPAGRRRGWSAGAVDRHHPSYAEYVRSGRPLTDAELGVLTGCLRAVVDRWFVGEAAAASDDGNEDEEEEEEDAEDNPAGVPSAAPAPPDVWHAMERVQLRFLGDTDTDGEAGADGVIVVRLPLADLSPPADDDSGAAVGVRCLEILTETVVRLSGGGGGCSHTD